jgi:hypothetical protein
MISISRHPMSFAPVQAPMLAPVRTSGLNRPCSARRPSPEAYASTASKTTFPGLPTTSIHTASQRRRQVIRVVATVAAKVGDEARRERDRHASIEELAQKEFGDEA